MTINDLALSLGGAREPQKASWTGPAEAKVSGTGPAEAKVMLDGTNGGKGELNRTNSWGHSGSADPRGRRFFL